MKVIMFATNFVGTVFIAMIHYALVASSDKAAMLTKGVSTQQ